jgi:hypothetical protein
MPQNKETSQERQLSAYGIKSFPLVELFTDIIYELNYEIYGNYDLDPINRDFAAYFCAAASAMVQIRWLEQGCPLDEKHMAKLSDTWIMSHWREAGIAAGSK